MRLNHNSKAEGQETKNQPREAKTLHATAESGDNSQGDGHYE